MSNPQQPDLGGQRDVGADAPRGPTPPENQPGHHPDEEQDKPPLDKFAAKLGTMPPEERAEVLKDETPAPAVAPARRGALVGVAAIVALVLAVLAGRRIRSRRLSAERGPTN